MSYQNGEGITFGADFDWDQTQELRHAMLMRRQQSETAWSQLKGTPQGDHYARRLVLVYGILEELGIEDDREIEQKVRKSLEKD